MEKLLVWLMGEEEEEEQPLTRMKRGDGWSLITGEGSVVIDCGAG